jgi:transposase-like protein
MRKERKHYTAEEKVTVLRCHLLDKVPVSDLCEELSLNPTVFYRWQKEFFENGAAAFQARERPHHQAAHKRQQMAGTVAAHAASHQHVHRLRPRATNPAPCKACFTQTVAQFDLVFVAQFLVKMPHVQIGIAVAVQPQIAAFG